MVDLGKEIIGGMRVNLESAQKQKITVHMGEEMNADGTVKWQLSAVPHYEDTWTLVSGTNMFETATMRNFRYVELIGLDDTTKQKVVGNPDSIMGWAMQQPFDETDSSFSATDGSATAAMLNRLYELSKYTIKATNQDVFVDSQARERAPYEGDLLVNSNTSYAVSGNYSLARHSNEWLMDNQTWPNDYRIFSVEMAYWDYIYTGNTDSIRECYNGLKRKLTAEVEHEDGATGLIRPTGSQAGNTALIDWPTSERDGYQGSYYDVVLNAEYVGIYHDMAVISEALGQTADAQVYQEKADKLKAALLKYAFDQTNGCFYDSLDQNYNPTKHSSTHATAYALNYGVYENQEMADRMCEFVYNKCKDEFKGSVYVTYFILEGLYRGNHGEMAEEIMTNPKTGTDVKTFAALLDSLNCTITPEAWGHKWKGNMTLSHPWGAAPGCAIVQGMFGIMPTSAGFRNFEIKLRPGQVASAEIKAPTVKGPVSVSYSNGNQEGIKNGQITAAVTIPANTRAKVSIPIDNVKLGYLLVNGIKTEAVNDGKFLTVELGSGTYQLAIDPTEAGYKPVLTVKASAPETAIIAGDTVQIQTKVTDQFFKEVKDDLEFSYESTDENILKVDKDGKVTASQVGDASIIVKVKYTGENPAEASTEIKFSVSSVLKGFEVRLDGNTAELAVGETAQARLFAIYADGKEEEIDPAQVTFQAGNDNDTVTVEPNGKVTRIKEGDILVQAVTTAKFNEVNSRMKDTVIQVQEVYRFDGQNNPLNGASIKDGNLYVPKGLKVVNTDEEKKGTVVSGKFIVENVAANVAFNAQDNNNRYFWQFRTDGSLKKHDKDSNVLGQTPISLKEGENSFRIATVEGKIYTWLNEELIDICEVVEGMSESGGFGTRNGNSESATFTELATGNQIAYLVETSISSDLPKIESIEKLEELEKLEVAHGTPREELVLPAQAKATLDNGSEVTVDIIWEGEYDGNTAGTYTLTGKIAENPNYKNPKDLTITAMIKVAEPGESLPAIRSVAELKKIQAAYGASLESLKLPGEVEITLDNGKKLTVAVTWEEDGYDSSQAGTYTLTGKLAESGDYTNPENLTASIIVEVAEQGADLPNIESIEKLEDLEKLEVAYGTPREELVLPAQAKAALDNGSEVTVDIIWEGEYDGNTAGTYTLTGKIAENPNYENPKNLTITAIIKVAEPGEFLPVIRRVAELEKIQAAYGTPLESLGLPAEVEVTLSDGKKAVAPVTWNGIYNGNTAGIYTLTGEIAESADYANPENLTASVIIEVAEKEPDNTEKEKYMVNTEKGEGVPKTVVTGTFSMDAVLIVEPVAEETDIYAAMKKLLPENMESLGVYEVHVRGGRIEGPFELSFEIGTQYDNRAAKVLHQKETEDIEQFDTVVKDGLVKVKVESLSPFMISIQKTEPTPEDPGTNPSPGDPGTIPAPEDPGTTPTPEDPGTTPTPGGTGTNPTPGGTGTNPTPGGTGTNPTPGGTGATPTPGDPGTNPTPGKPGGSDSNVTGTQQGGAVTNSSLDSDKKPTTAVQTGDETKILFGGMMALLSFVVIVFACFSKRRFRRK